MQVRTSLQYIAEADHKKLDFFLKSRGVSRRMITDLKYIGCLLVNQQVATTIHPIKKGDVVTLLFPREEELSCQSQPGELSILYEDEDILAVDKPSGIATHPALGTKDGTLGNFVTHYYVSQHCPMPFRPVSRLDKHTSGVILIAKHKFSHHQLAQQQTDGTFQKTYLALVTGVPQEKEGEINLPIARESQQSLRRMCRADGKPACTHYRVLAHTRRYSLLELSLKTGRTHQIRVHLSHIGHPIVGDPLYGITPADRLYLHSYRAEFLHPVTGEVLTVTAPSHFETLITQIENEEPNL